VVILKHHRVNDAGKRLALSAHHQVAAAEIAYDRQAGAFGDCRGHAQIQRRWEPPAGVVPNRVPRHADGKNLMKMVLPLFGDLASDVGERLADHAMGEAELSRLGLAADTQQEFAHATAVRFVDKMLEVWGERCTAAVDAHQGGVDAREAGPGGKADVPARRHHEVRQWPSCLRLALARWERALNVNKRC